MLSLATCIHFLYKDLYKQQQQQKITYNGTNQDLQKAFEDACTGEDITKKNGQSDFYKWKIWARNPEILFFFKNLGIQLQTRNAHIGGNQAALQSCKMESTCTIDQAPHSTETIIHFQYTQHSMNRLKNVRQSPIIETKFL
jgi:hypothetical protein